MKQSLSLTLADSEVIVAAASPLAVMPVFPLHSSEAMDIYCC